MMSSILDYKWDIAGIKVIRSRARRKRPIISPGIMPAKNKSLTIVAQLSRQKSEIFIMN